MRRASIKLLSFSKPRSISRNLTTQICSTLVSTDQSCTQLNSCSNSKGLLFFTPKTHQFQKTPSQNFNTQVEIHSKLPSRQRKIKERSQIENDFEAAKTAEDMLEAFKEMEANFDEKDLGLACLKIGLKLDQEGEDPEKVLPYAIRALAVFDSENQISLPIAMTLQLLGSTSYCLNKFNDALGYLNRANKILGRLEEEGSFRAEDLKSILHAVQLELANTKTAMGRREEALGNLRHSVEIKEFLMGEDRKEVGNAYRDLAEACVAILNFKEGLPYCLKALELHIKLLGENSVEVAHDRRLLGVIHTGMEEYEKALEQNQLSQKVLKNWGRSSDLLRAEIDAANMHIALGRFEAAINTLKGVVQQTEKDSEHRALIFITMAKALVSQEKFADAKRCLEIASGTDKVDYSLAVNDSFIKGGFRGWNKTGRFDVHVGGIGSFHNQANEKYSMFINSKTSVAESLCTYSKEAKLQYKSRLTYSLKCIRFLLNQGLACRGHNESEESWNRGNFLALLTWFSENNSEVAKVVLGNALGNNRMTSPSIQKELINCCAKETTRLLIDDIGDDYFRIMADESSDVS